MKYNIKNIQELLRLQKLAGIISEDINIVNKILDKISDQGIKSLKPEEKEYLEKYSRGEKNIPEPVSIQNKPTSTSSIKADVYPFYYDKETRPEEIKIHQERVELYDDIAREFLKPLIDTISQQLEISPKDIRASFDGLYGYGASPNLSIQIKLPNDKWKKPWTGNNLIMQTESEEGIVINSKLGIKVTYDKQEGATLPEVQDAYDDLYMIIKKEKILNLINIKITQFIAGFKYQDLIAPNTPVLYTGK